MEIKKFILQFLGVNCYLVNYKNKYFLIDPGSEFEKIKEYILNHEIKLEFILNTHGHYDHISAVPELVQEFSIPFYVHEKEEEIITDPQKNLSSTFYPNELSLKTYNLIKGDFSKDFLIPGLEIMNLPGHTPGSILIKMEEYLFTGDVLFKDSIGRTDLPCGNNRAMNDSLRKIKRFDKSFKIFPGHGPESTIETEIENNFFLKNLVF
ncbi:MAG: MBL fold metallo-hydrolase [Actinobacteria bacterium]|nr:MBL fold metallo-hydrolase [Actinomycetota bacterium]MCL6087344.1 MBL fold metallo-hydrolase [Actinomycetota bacterium]